MLQNVLDKVVNFKDFSRANKEINYYSRTLTEFKGFSRQQTAKIQDLSKIVVHKDGFTKMHRQIALMYV